MPREVSAVHRRHVSRLERAEVLRVVPVVEVAAEALEAVHGLERGLEALDGVDGPEPAEIPGGDGREQVEPEVRGRGPVRHDRLRILLEVVGRQRVVRGTDERREEPPRSSRDQPEGARVPGRQRPGPRGAPRQADPSSRQGRRCPEQQEGHRDGPGLGVSPRDQGRRRGGEGDPPAHAPGEPEEVQAEPGFRLRRGHPLQQPAARHVHARERPRDRVAHQPRLVRQHRERERRLRRGQDEVAADRADVAPLRDARRAGDQPAEDRQERGEPERRQNERGPDQGRGGRQRPSDDQRQEGRRRRQRAPQVVHHLPAPDQRERRAENPRQQLPVAARPAVLTGRGDPVV